MKELAVLIFFFSFLHYGWLDPALSIDVWDEWTNWSGCSVTCGEGKSTRSRICVSKYSETPVCKGPKSQSKKCVKDPCNEPKYPTEGSSSTRGYEEKPSYDDRGVWNEWSSWSKPSRSCGSYPVLSTRQRTCNGKKCQGIGKESRSHKLPPCFIDGKWSEWSLWSEPQRTCGEGSDVVRRERHCDNPAPTPSGKRCEGDPKETKQVRLPQCEVDGHWSDWCEWSKPTETCHSEGQSPATRERSRSCDNPNPSKGGKPCEGEDSEIEEIDLPPCLTKGGWCEWSKWSSLRVTCGDHEAEVTRERLCKCPAPRYAGECLGVPVEHKSVKLPECIIDGQWSEWSEWSEAGETCGSSPSMRIRTRTCTNPEPKGGYFCEGDAEEVEEIIIPECETDGQWCEWTQWSSPGKTCGPHVITRHRECSDPPPSPGGKPCPGPDSQTKKINGPPCY